MLKQLDMLKKDKHMTQWKPDLVYLISPQTSLFKTSGKKFSYLY